MSAVADIEITSLPYTSLTIKDSMECIEYIFDFDMATDAQKALALALFNTTLLYTNSGGILTVESILMEFDRHNMRHLFIENKYE